MYGYDGHAFRWRDGGEAPPQPVQSESRVAARFLFADALAPNTSYTFDDSYAVSGLLWFGVASVDGDDVIWQDYDFRLPPPCCDGRRRALATLATDAGGTIARWSLGSSYTSPFSSHGNYSWWDGVSGEDGTYSSGSDGIVSRGVFNSGSPGAWSVEVVPLSIPLPPPLPPIPEPATWALWAAGLALLAARARRQPAPDAAAAPAGA